jgi:plasmid stabilization system protein ParE
MTLPIIFHPEALAEFDDSAVWYERQCPGLGADFLARVQLVFDRLVAFPRMHQVVVRDVRRAVVSKFPYVEYYRVRPDCIEVIAVHNTRRDPARWQDRI